MRSDPHEDKDSLDELLKLYNNLRNGLGGFLDEDEFEELKLSEDLRSNALNGLAELKDLFKNNKPPL